ncbi:MAG TPA: hypothetical protein VHA11_05910 [Bryobacteraceae bacterium]|nr:hypothetical protein [Bryobacteraceae bacterium]
MTAALLAIYAFTCAALLWDGWRRSNPFVELTFLAGAGSSIVLLPQGLALWLAGDVLPETGLAKAFLMAALSNLALLAGWRRYAPLPAAPPPAHRPPELRRAFWWGALFIAIGLASSVALAGLSGGLLGQFTSSGATTLEWRGMPVAWVFFVSFLMTGIALTALAALGLHSRPRLLVPLAASLLPLAWIILLNRRSAAAALATTVAGVFAFGSSRRPPRWAVPALLGAGVVTAFVFPALRGNDFVQGDFSRLESLEPGRVVAEGLVNPDAEFTHLVYGMAVTSADDAYEFGAGFYNQFVTLFVPKLLVGEAAKQDLLFRTSASDYFNNSLGWSARPTTAPTGPGCAFRQFGYFGCFYFFLMARALRMLSEKARGENDVFLQTFFIILLAPAVASMTNDIYTLYHPVFIHLPALLAARHFCHA